MPVPLSQDFLLPIFQFASGSADHTREDVAWHLSSRFKLAEAEMRGLLPGGRESMFMTRLAWAMRNLGKARLIEQFGQAGFRITQRGLDLLASEPVQIGNGSLTQDDQGFRDDHELHDQNTEGRVGIPGSSQETPDEHLETTHARSRKDLAEQKWLRKSEQRYKWQLRA